jgi:DNA-binding NarL/FixJ family response regulator
MRKAKPVGSTGIRRTETPRPAKSPKSSVTPDQADVKRRRLNVPLLHNCVLSDRKILIIRAVVAGYTEQEIACRLFLGTEDVKRELQDIFVILGVSNKLELVLSVLHHGLVDTDGLRESAPDLDLFADAITDTGARA